MAIIFPNHCGDTNIKELEAIIGLNMNTHCNVIWNVEIHFLRKKKHSNANNSLINFSDLLPTYTTYIIATTYIIIIIQYLYNIKIVIQISCEASS